MIYEPGQASFILHALPFVFVLLVPFLVDLVPPSAAMPSSLDRRGESADGHGSNQSYRNKPVKIRIGDEDMLDNRNAFQLLWTKEIVGSKKSNIMEGHPDRFSTEGNISRGDSWILSDYNDDNQTAGGGRKTHELCCVEPSNRDTAPHSAENLSSIASIRSLPTITARLETLDKQDLVALYIINATAPTDLITRKRDSDINWHNLNGNPDEPFAGPWAMCERSPLSEHGTISKLRIMVRPAKWLQVVRSQVLVKVGRWFIGFHGARSLTMRFGNSRAPVVGRVRQRRTRSRRI